MVHESGEKRRKAEVPNIELKGQVLEITFNYLTGRYVYRTSFRPAVVKQSIPSINDVAPTKAVEARRTW
jgi:hypothetical protein